MPGRCEVIEYRDEDGRRHVAFARVAEPIRKCEFCHLRTGSLQCDYPIGGVDGSTGKKKTCDKYICGQCAGRKGGFDYCPDHRERAGVPLPALDFEGARWLDCTRYAANCAMPNCNVRVEEGERSLYLPKERKIVCEECGESSRH
jgi:hypothetical protein